jgi:predicted kinase
MWQSKNTVLIYISEGFQYNPSVAGCGLLHTVIQETESEWNVNPEFVEKFKIIHESGGSIVFFSNQNIHANTIKARFTRCMQKFLLPSGDPIPVMALFATKHNCFMKPFTNLWKVMGFMYQIKNKAIPDVSTSIYIGKFDGGLYVKNWQAVAAKKFTKKIYTTRSDSDRAFAHNVGVQFVSRAQFFYGKPEPKWKWCFFLMSLEDRMKYIKQHNESEEPNLRAIMGDKKYLVIVIGRPSSGRSTLIKRIIAELGVPGGVDLARPDAALTPRSTAEQSDEIGSFRDQESASGSNAPEPTVIHVSKKVYPKKLIKTIKEAIWKGTTIIKLDFPDYAHRNALIKISREYDTPTIIVHLTTDKKLCEILNRVKIQTTTDFSLELHEHLAYIDWQKKYEAPEYDQVSDPDVTVVEYPMVVRLRREFKYQYSTY